MLVTLLCAVGIGWATDYLSQTKENHRLLREVEFGDIVRDWERTWHLDKPTSPRPKGGVF